MNDRQIRLRSSFGNRVAFLLLLCGTFFVSTLASGTEIWLGGTDPIVRRTSYKDDQPSDYMQLFDSNAPWSNAAQNIKAFKSTTQFVVGATDEQLTKMFANLKERKIAFAMETLMLPPGDNGCGKGIEGYLDPHGFQTVLERIRRLGGDLRYVAMDEPLWFGHVSNQANACHSLIDAIARDVASRVSVIKSVFPGAEIGDIEPIGAPEQPKDWLDEISRWTDAYRRAVGSPLHFFDADLTWSGSWQAPLRALAPQLRSSGILFGIIYDGDSTDSTGVAWTAHAEERFTQVENDPSITPDRAILQSWTLQPSRMLPESEPGTMTYLVNRYLARGTVLTLNRASGRLVGHLADASGNPVSGGQVELFSVDGGNAATKSVRSLTGEVPATAVKAAVGLRINAECGCSGPAKIVLGSINYRDGGSRLVVRGPFLTNNADTAFDASPGQAIARNSEPFPVTGSSRFTLEVPMGATYASVDSGYVGLMFLNAQGAEVQRLRLRFQPATNSLGKATTNSDGSYAFQLPSSASGTANYRAAFSGDKKTRAASVALQ